MRAEIDDIPFQDVSLLGNEISNSASELETFVAELDALEMNY